MTILSSANLEKVRTQPHGTQLYLSIYRPSTIFECQVTGSYDFGAMTVNYDSVITGTYTNTYPDGTVLIGTTPNSDDIGRIRVRSATGTYVTLAENTFSLVSGAYMTFLDYVDITAIYPRIIQDQNDLENVIFYKDYDIEYSNQNLLYGSIPCAGSHRATFVNTSTGTVYYSATGSVNLASGTMTYLWRFEGGTPTGSILETPGFIKYNTPGHYKTTLTITASGTSGVTYDTTYRYVSVYDRIGEGNNTPVIKWSLTDFSGGRSEGGYSVGIKVFENLGAIEPNALVVIFSDDVYGTESISLGGNSPNASNIVFVGYILQNSIRFNYKEGYVEFKCGSVTQLMKQAEGFSVSCESVATPSTWFELSAMTVRKAIYHYLKWHSTVMRVADFQYIGDDRNVQYFDADRGSLYDAINSFIDSGLLGETVSDRQGKIWAEISPPGHENPFADIPYNFTLQKHDWVGEPDITEKRTGETSVIEMGGIVYNGDGLGFSAYLSTAPSLTPYYRGKIESPREGLILVSQTQLNQVAGNYVASKNTNFGDVTMNLAGNYRNIDIAPQERFMLDINTNDTLEPDSLLGVSFRPVSMNWQYNAKNGSFSPQVSFNPIITGTAGQTTLIPPVPPELGYSYPSLELPPLPYFSPEPVTQSVGRTVLMADSTLGFVYTKDFDAASPSWIAWNAGLDTQYQTSTKRQFFITPNGAVWCLLIGVVGKTYTYDRLYRAPYIGGIFQLVIDRDFIISQYPGSYTDYRISTITYNPKKEEEIGVVMGAVNGGTLAYSVNLWVINYPTMTKGTANIPIAGNSSRSGSLSFDPINSKWVLLEDFLGGIPGIDYKLWRLDYNGSTLEYTSPALFSNDAPFLYRGTNTQKLYIQYSPDFYFTDDNGTTRTLIGDSQEVGATRWSYACDPTGQFIMGNWTVAGQRGASGDYGYTWTGLPYLPAGGAYVFAYAGAGDGSSTGWIAAHGVVRFSPNFGNTWIGKEGNLLQIAPIPDIYGIFVKVDTRTI